MDGSPGNEIKVPWHVGCTINTAEGFARCQMGRGGLKASAGFKIPNHACQPAALERRTTLNEFGGNNPKTCHTLSV